MSKSERNGVRKQRRTGTRTPELGYYLILTDTKETERNFFNGLRDSIPEEYKNRIVVKVLQSATRDMIDDATELLAKDSQYREAWLVFDRDRVVGFDDIIKKAKSKGLKVGWSNPCFEIFMSAYFGEMPNISDSVECCHRFGELFEKKTKVAYDKAMRDIYAKLVKYGNEKAALELAERKLREKDDCKKPSEKCPASTVWILVREIRNKCEKRVPSSEIS